MSTITVSCGILFTSLKKSPVFHLFNPTSLFTQDPWQILIFLPFYSFAFTRCLINEIIQYVAFLHWCLLLSSVHLKLINVSVAWELIPFFPLWIVFLHMGIPRFAYPFIYWKTSWLLLFFTIMSKPTIKNHLHIFM